MLQASVMAKSLASAREPIGWRQGEERSGTGQWCEVRKAAEDWALKTCDGPTLDVSVLTYNLFWWNLFGQRGGNGRSAGRLIAGAGALDVMGFQECDNVGWVLGDAKKEGLPDGYEAIPGPRALAIVYRTTWEKLAAGSEDVGEDSPKQHYGRRAAQWVRLRRDGRTLFFVNHHGPLPVSESGGCAGSATAYNILGLIAKNAQAEDGIILVGDFNAQSYSSRIQAMDKHLRRVYSGSAMGGVDHIYSNCDAVKTSNLGTGGSDHDALSVVIKI